MATLTSPGVEVSVINESFYVPSDAGTTPLFIVASGQDKDNGAGDGTAAGTQTANANTVYLISSQRELTETFGLSYITDTGQYSSSENLKIYYSVLYPLILSNCSAVNITTPPKYSVSLSV